MNDLEYWCTGVYSGRVKALEGTVLGKLEADLARYADRVPYDVLRAARKEEGAAKKGVQLEAQPMPHSKKNGHKNGQKTEAS